MFNRKYIFQGSIFHPYTAVGLLPIGFSYPQLKLLVFGVPGLVSSWDLGREKADTQQKKTTKHDY